MLDCDGFRPNVGIILLNQQNEVFWGKRIRNHSWQFPQGGIEYGEPLMQAMYRELHEEVGLMPRHVRVLARTRDWLKYEVPDKFIRHHARGFYKGQKQIWFLLQLIGLESDFNLQVTAQPEFDAWRWSQYWIPMDSVIEFKRTVYTQALTELAYYLPADTHCTDTHCIAQGTQGYEQKPVPKSRYLRGLRYMRKVAGQQGRGSI